MEDWTPPQKVLISPMRVVPVCRIWPTLGWWEEGWGRWGRHGPDSQQPLQMSNPDVTRTHKFRFTNVARDRPLLILNTSGSAALFVCQPTARVDTHSLTHIQVRGELQVMLRCLATQNQQKSVRLLHQQVGKRNRWKEEVKAEEEGSRFIWNQGRKAGGGGAMFVRLINYSQMLHASARAWRPQFRGTH